MARTGRRGWRGGIAAVLGVRPPTSTGQTFPPLSAGAIPSDTTSPCARPMRTRAHSAARARCPGPPTFPSSLRRGPSRPHASSLRLSPGLAESSTSGARSRLRAPLGPRDLPPPLRDSRGRQVPKAGGSHLSLSEHTLPQLAECTELGTGREPRVLASRAWKQMGDRRVASRGRAVGAEGTFYERPRGQRGRRGRGGRQGLAAGLVDVRLEGRWGRQVGATGLISPGVLAVLHKCPRRGPF